MEQDSQDDLRQANIPAMGETDLDDQQSAVEEAEIDPGESVETYQDDLDYKDADTDPIANEETENPADLLGIPESEFKDELDKYVVTDTGEGDDDMRETIEDRDEDDDNAASTS